MYVYSIQYLSAQSLGATANLAAIDVTKYGKLSLQFVWSAGSTPSGTLKLQASNENGAAADASNWVDISGATLSVSGNTGTGIIALTSVPYRFLRVVYTRSSGDATLAAYFVGKDI